MIVADVYTPWREDPDALQARSVGREEVLRALHAAAHAFAEGRSPNHLYLFGPRGMGKSHVLALARHGMTELLEQRGLRAVTVPEDIPELRSAEAILGRIAEQAAGPRWMRWGARPGPVASLKGPMIVFFEGLDRQLNGLGEEERRRLRGLLDQAGPFLIIGTGLALSEPFTSHDTAFYGAFSPWPVYALAEQESALLLDRAAGLAEDEDWPPRRQALVTLAGGSPRTLVALGRAAAAAPRAWASEHLYAVVQQFTAHYQMRFRDLAPQQQPVLELLAMAPRELSPTEIGEALGISTSHASMLCHRLMDAGVLLRRSEGRAAWFRLGEPLFRFWMEYRNAPWEQTRVGLLGRLLEAVLEPDALVQLWMENPDPALQGAVEEVLQRAPAKKLQVWRRLSTEFQQAVRQGEQVEKCFEIVKRAGKSPPPEHVLVQMMSAVSVRDVGLRERLSPVLRHNRLDALCVAWDFEESLLAEANPRDRFRWLLLQLEPPSSHADPARPLWDGVARIVLRALSSVDPRGRSWALDLEERARLVAIPVLRAIFLERGKRPRHPALLDEMDLLGSGLPSARVDWDLLLASATRHHHGPLTGSLIALGLAEARVPPLPVCHASALSIGGDDWLELLRRSLQQRPQALRFALTWAGTFATGSDPAWERLRAGVARLVDAGLAAGAGSPLLVSRLNVGFLELGLRAMPRLLALAETLSTVPDLVERLRYAVALTAQLAEARTARLYPELEALARLLQPRAAPGL